MANKLRVCSISNMTFPADVPIRFDGNVVGKTISNNEIVIYDDVAHRLIQGGEAQFSLEVLRKNDY